jgi:hypothetical protein
VMAKSPIQSVFLGTVFRNQSSKQFKTAVASRIMLWVLIWQPFTQAAVFPQMGLKIVN